MPKKKKRVDTSSKTPKQAVPTDSGGFLKNMSPRKKFWAKEIAAILFMYIMTVAVFFPFVTEDTRSSAGGDAANASIWTLTGHRLSEELGTTALWNPYVFMGYPSYGSLNYLGHINFNPLHRTVLVARYLFGPYNMNDHIIYYFLSGLFIYIFARGVGLPVLVALFAGTAMLLNPHNVSLMEAGHGSKHWTIAVIPLVLLTTWRLVKKQRLLDMTLLGLSVGILLLSMHVQMAYYGLLTVGFYVLVWGIRKAFKDIKQTIKGWGLFAGANALGIGLAFYLYWPLLVYSKYSIRGTSPLKAESGPTGLDWEYATNWSFHPVEMLQFLVPGLFGLGGSQPPGRGLSPETVMDYNLYWGHMPFTQSSLYMGIIVLILAVFAGITLFRKIEIVQWMSITAIVSLIISFGRHLPILYKPLYLYMPYFAKFRIPSLILTLTTICVVILAGFGLVELLNQIKKSRENQNKTLPIILVVFMAIALFGIIFAVSGSDAPEIDSGMFVKDGELSTYGARTVSMLIDLRWILFNKSMMTTAMYLLIFAASTFLVLKMKEKKLSRYVIIGLVALLLTTMDLFSLDKKFMHPVPNTSLRTSFAPSPTSRFLQEQQKISDEPFRIYPIGTGYQSIYWMHQGIESIGGYSAVKLRVYQDLLDYGLNVTHQGVPNLVISGMMNGKYIVHKGEFPFNFEKVFDGGANNESVYLNPFALPRAWFVDSVSYVEDKVALMDSVASRAFDPTRVAYVNEEPNFAVGDSALYSNVLVPKQDYTAHGFNIYTNAIQDGFLVVSEIYYPQGWEVYIDGEKSKVWQVNHALRGVAVPAGKHIVRFEFHPPENSAGIVVSWISILLILGLAGFSFWKNRKDYFPGIKQ